MRGPYSAGRYIDLPPSHMDQEPLPEYLRRFFQKKAQTPNFPENTAIEKCIARLLPSQLALHLSREPSKSLAELYTIVEKYARSDADHRRRVEQRRLMRQQQAWPHGNQNSTRHNPQYIFPVEPSQRADPHHDAEPYMTTPTAQTFNPQLWMVVGRVWGGYPRISGLQVSVLGFSLCPQVFGFGYLKSNEFGADLNLYPRIHRRGSGKQHELQGS